MQEKVIYPAHCDFFFVLIQLYLFLLSYQHYQQCGCCFFLFFFSENVRCCSRWVWGTCFCVGGEFNCCVLEDGEESQSWQKGTGLHGGLSLTEGLGWMPPWSGQSRTRAKRKKMRVLGGVGSELKGRRGCFQFLRNLLSLLSSPPPPILLPLEKGGQGVNVMQHTEYSNSALIQW